MTHTGIALLVASLLLVSAGTQGRSEGTEKETITGTVVGYDVGLQLATGACRQTLVVRRTSRNLKEQSEYILVRYEESCLKGIPERALKSGPHLRFSLTRNADCDQALEGLLYIHNGFQAGPKGRIPRVRLVSGKGGEKIPPGKQLPCYVLRPGDFQPRLKERVITGVVLQRDSRPAREVDVVLRYDDANSDLLRVKTDDQGQFRLWVYEGFSYTVRVWDLAAGGYGAPVRIPARGGIRPLRLVIER